MQIIKTNKQLPGYARVEKKKNSF
uniref:Uncharacterized protein n=1 Tax=Rhizophora mucronata TaxID=61149 RepID=A0A2P2PZR5_RHIMU